MHSNPCYPYEPSVPHRAKRPPKARILRRVHDFFARSHDRSLHRLSGNSRGSVGRKHPRRIIRHRYVRKLPPRASSGTQNVWRNLKHRYGHDDAICAVKGLTGPREAFPEVAHETNASRKALGGCRGKEISGRRCHRGDARSSRIRQWRREETGYMSPGGVGGCHRLPTQYDDQRENTSYSAARAVDEWTAAGRGSLEARKQ